METPQVLIRMDNIRSGGALQVAQSFVTEMAGLLRAGGATSYPWLATTSRLLVSDEVAASCSPADLQEVGAEVIPRRSRLAGFTQAWRADVVFTLFGPTYDRVVARRSIVGFADVTSLYPELAKNLAKSVAARARLRLRRSLSRTFFRRSDRVIVEAPHLAADLDAAWGIGPDRVSIVPNVVNGVFDGRPPPAGPADEQPMFCYVTRAYPHKNLSVLGPVAAILAADYGIDVRFLLTLREDEWADLDESVRAASVNLGPVAVSDLPAIYGRSTGCVFPSLLEGFSATPLEALATGTPLIASDRPFCRDALGDTALYADPTDPRAWAAAIQSVLTDPGATQARVARGRQLIASWPTARDRARAYLDAIASETAER